MCPGSSQELAGLEESKQRGDCKKWDQEATRCEMKGPPGYVGKDSEFYSLCKQKPLASFEQRKGIILLSF